MRKFQYSGKSLQKATIQLNNYVYMTYFYSLENKALFVKKKDSTKALEKISFVSLIKVILFEKDTYFPYFTCLNYFFVLFLFFKKSLKYYKTTLFKNIYI